jgi:mono/diheme cytochrome c family protein
MVAWRMATWLALGCAMSLPAPGADGTDGSEVYERNCLNCHQADGQGVPGMQPGLVNSPWLAADGTALAAFVLTGGFDSARRTAGSGDDNVMPPFLHLDDSELAAVLSYIRAEFGAKTDPVTVSEVKAARVSRPAAK